MRNNQFFKVLAIRPFLFLWLAEAFSQIAFNLANYILIIIVYELTNSNTAVSGIVLSFTVPAIIFGLIAGVYVDKWNKQKVLFITNISRFAILFILALFHTNLVLIYFLTFAIAIIAQFFIPAETPMIPLLVKRELLLPANALFGMALYGSIFIAYALASPFLILFGNFYAVLITSVLFFLASISITFIKVSKGDLKQVTQASKGTFIKFAQLKIEIKDVLQVIAKTKNIYTALSYLILSQVMILIIAVIGPGFAKQVLDINVEQAPLFIVAPGALGMIIGAIIIGNCFNKYSKQKMANFGVVLLGLGLFILPFAAKVTSREFVSVINQHLPKFFTIDILHIVILVTFILGFANALVFVPSNTILQEETPEKLRGRIYGALNALTGIFSLFPIIIVGGLADIFGVGRVLTGLGIILILVGILRSKSK